MTMRPVAAPSRAATGAFASWGHRTLDRVDCELRFLAIDLRRLNLSGHSLASLADDYGLPIEMVDRLVTRGWH